MPSVRPRGTRWLGEYRDANGRKRSRTFATKAAARAWAAGEEDKVRRGVHLDPDAGKVTLRAWCELWWDARVTEATTAATDRGRLDKHVLSAFGDYRLTEISSLQVQSWVKRLSQSGLAAATVRSCHQLLSAMLKAAVADERLTRNPCTATKLPTVPGGREVYLTRDQVDAVCSEMDDPRYAAVVRFLAYTGCRWGEMAGLPLRSINLLRREVSFGQTLEEISGKKTIKAYPKTRASRRTVGLPMHVVDEVAAHLARNPAQRDELVFRGPRGAALSRVHFNLRVWKPALEAAGLAHMGARPHDLRHTCASWLVQEGVALYEVQAQMGHESFAMVQRYAHLAPDRHLRTRAALERPESAHGRHESAAR